MVIDVVCEITTIPPQEPLTIIEAVLEEHTYRGIRLPELSQKAISGVGGLAKGSPLITESRGYK